MDYPGGTNKSIIHRFEEPNFANPTPDFVSFTRLDFIKNITSVNIFIGSFWSRACPGFRPLYPHIDIWPSSGIFLFFISFIFGSQGLATFLAFTGQCEKRRPKKRAGVLIYVLIDSRRQLSLKKKKIKIFYNIKFITSDKTTLYLK